MPHNPSRKSQGGDVEGTTKTDNTWSIGSGVDVSTACFDPGYPMENSAKIIRKGLKSHLVKGYCDYGRVIGEPDDAFEDWSNV